MGFPSVPPPRKRGKTRLTTLPKEPKISDDAYSSSSKIDKFNFHNPGPMGTESGRTKEKDRAQWSENGQGRMSDTWGTHTYGQPMRSMREAGAPSGRHQENAETPGCKTRQISTTQQSENKLDNIAELSRETSKGQEPRR